MSCVVEGEVRLVRSVSRIIGGVVSVKGNKRNGNQSRQTKPHSPPPSLEKSSTSPSSRYVSLAQEEVREGAGYIVRV